MLNIKANLQIYNYSVTHVRGIKNHLAYVLSRRLVWLNPDHTLGPDEGLEIITLGDKVDWASFQLLHHFATRPKSKLPFHKDAGVEQHEFQGKA